MPIEYCDLADFLGIKRSIIQAPMAGVQDSELAIAVCEGGGLGSLPCGMLTVEQVQVAIQRLHSSVSGPYNLNFFCHQVPDFDESAQLQWRSQLQPFAKELGVEFGEMDARPSRVPFNHDVADVIEPYRPAVVSFHFGLPDQDLLDRVKGWGSKILSSATTLAEALWLEARGVDGIIAQGFEAGGHRGMFLAQRLSQQLGTLALVPQVAAKVGVPVIAAGGIVDSQSVKAALMLGASAVQVGTAYLLCHEARTSTLHRQALQSERAQHTAVTRLLTGKPARGIVNRLMDELVSEAGQIPPFPFASNEISLLRAKAEAQGRDDFTPLWSGQNVSGCRDISATELTRSLWPD